MFNRQKILLGLLEEFGGSLARTELQKILFLFCQETGDAVYEFVPYKYGCFSFQTYADKGKLTDKGFLVDTERWELADLSNKEKYRSQLDFPQRKALWALRERFADKSRNELVQQVYLAHPYYAIHSQIASDVLSTAEMKLVEQARPQVKGRMIVSIGYEGLSLEGYLNLLIRRGVNVVCDVRKNPLSRKFGFSKTALRNALEEMGIEYRHYPQLGIPSENRTTLNSQADYDALFGYYEKVILSKQMDAVAEISELVQHRDRVALLCYERLPQQCHRTRVADAVLARLHDETKLWEDRDERACPDHSQNVPDAFKELR